MATDTSEMFNETWRVLGIADFIADRFADGMSVAAIAEDQEITESGVEWWLAVAKIGWPEMGGTPVTLEYFEQVLDAVIEQKRAAERAIEERAFSEGCAWALL